MISVCNEGKKVIENLTTLQLKKERDWEDDKEMYNVLSREKTLVNITPF